MSVPQILTLSEVADFLGVGAPAVAIWARDGRLPVCARSEGGELLFYRWRVESDGPTLAASEAVRFQKASNRRRFTMLHDGHRLPCGCVLVGDGDALGQPVWLCPDLRALQALDRLASAFVAAGPDDPFFRRLARVTSEALARHLTTPKHEGESAAETGRAETRCSPASSSETGCEARVT